ncbi:recombinase RecB [Ignisphaera sp. 4213-co]|uniref:Recombinase RecB n=1 Tax=Ignisphaera cupida TaxID=3050454 RepID=A0ABD4Z8U6_9CREN|nr:recombinase RecB [Ignisphaera sp. 4213-co]MDK6029134.1 recombinase RecB [Ignisphaera sp. 4213-co]
MSNRSSFSASRRWLSSERIALRVLEELGFKILETRKKVLVNGIEVGEIDAVVEDSSGNKWGVEIKAGRIDVTGIRQIYVNSIIENVKPMVICKGFADDAAKELAEKLGVKVIELSDVFLVDSEELEIIVREVVENAIADYFELFFTMPSNIKQEWYETLKVLANSLTIDEACEKLGVDINTLAKRLNEMRERGLIPKWARKFSSIKRVAQIIVQRQAMSHAMEESHKILEMIKTLNTQFSQLIQMLSSLEKNLKSFEKNQ